MSLGMFSPLVPLPNMFNLHDAIVFPHCPLFHFCRTEFCMPKGRHGCLRMVFCCMPGETDFSSFAARKRRPPSGYVIWAWQWIPKVGPARRVSLVVG